jgi:hypothetical protein
MAEDRKKVWPKVMEAYFKQVEETKHHRIVSPSLPRSDLLMANLVKVQRAFQKECKPVSEERNANFSPNVEVNDDAHALLRSGDPLWREMMRVNVLATIAEMTELLETTPWKPWRQNDGKVMLADEVWEARLEVMDAMCFLMNCWLLLGGDGECFAHLYLAKMSENSRRQKEGY